MGRTADLDKEMKRIEQGEAWNESDEVVQAEVKRPLDKVIPVRLSAADWTKLRAEAHELGIGPTTLARMWILERLRFQSAASQEAYSPFRLIQNAFLGNFVSLPTPREAEIMELIAQGHSPKQVAEELGISLATVTNHIASLMGKLYPRLYPAPGVVRVVKPKQSNLAEKQH